MRYMKQVETGEVRQVSHDDDETFGALKAEVLSNGRPAWAQTGSHDPAVAAAITSDADGVAPDLRVTLPAAAANADASRTLGTVRRGATVSAIEYVPESTITGQNTDSRTLTVVNKGQDGTGNTTVGTLALTSGVNAPADDAKAFTLSGTAANKKVAKGDVLEAVSTHVGTTGLADPGGQVRVVLDAS